MRTFLMSFNPIWADKIKSGEKIYEYRQRFCDEDAKVYMYITKPVMQVCGILELKRRIPLAEWEKKYSYNNELVQRIKKYRIKNNYAMPIKCYHETNALSLEAIRNEFKGFFAPQFCYDLDRNIALKEFIEKKCGMTGVSIYNEIEVEKESEICRDYMRKE